MPQHNKIKSFAITVNFFVLFLWKVSFGIQEENPGEPLYLTPLIRQGEHVAAQEAALVQAFHPVISYSGFITVNEEFNSSLFFWYFPAEETYSDPEDYRNNDIPVILWNDGGPGISAMFSIFGQNGPFLGTADDGVNYTSNPFSWNKKYHMIYMDNPVEVGFSHTKSEQGYITSGEDAAKDIYEFLSQFFALFPHLQQNPFYNAGVSYGATYAIQTAHHIHEKNLNSPIRYINLAGMIVDSPWIDPYTQSHYGHYLFNAGLINEKFRDRFVQKEDEIRTLIDTEKYLDAFLLSIQLSQVSNLTGYNALPNIYADNIPFINMTELVTSNLTRKLLHVGSLEFKFVSTEQQSRMHSNFMRSAKPQLDILLQAGYRFLLYVRNMDGTTGHLGIQNMLKTLSWPGADELVGGTREVWQFHNRVAGYMISSRNATMVIIRNAGHGCTFDQPAAVLNTVDLFLATNNTS